MVPKLRGTVSLQAMAQKTVPELPKGISGKESPNLYQFISISIRETMVISPLYHHLKKKKLCSLLIVSLLNHHQITM